MSTAADFFQSKEFGEFQKEILSRGRYWMIGQRVTAATAGPPQCGAGQAWHHRHSGTGGQQDDAAACLVIRVKLPLGFCWLWVPYGPAEYTDDFFNQLSEIAKRNRALFARIEGSLHMQPISQTVAKLYRLHIKPSPFRYTPAHSLFLNLTHSTEILMAQMKPKGRYNIKVAEKHGVIVREFGTYSAIPKKDFDSFYALLKATGERDMFGIHPKSYYEILLTHFGALHMCSLFLAYHKGNIVGGIIVMFYGKTAFYYYGASDHFHRMRMAPYLLQWHAIRSAKARGCEVYDFFGTAPDDVPNHPWQGVSAFKKKFGGNEVAYPHAIDIVYRPLIYKLYQALKKIF